MTEFEHRLLKWCTPHEDGSVDCRAYVHPKEPLIRLEWGTTFELIENPDAKYVCMAIQNKSVILVSEEMHKALKRLKVVYLKMSTEY